MKHHFYSHLVEIDTVVTELEVLDLNAEEKHELVKIMETTIHHVVLNTVLSELSEEDKKQFLDHLAGNNHSELWKLLTEKVPEVHEKIKKSVHKVKKEMSEDIMETHKKRRK
jgi:hypothetical protein